MGWGYWEYLTRAERERERMGEIYYIIDSGIVDVVDLILRKKVSPAGFPEE
jgi:hypothetical protein